MKLIADLQAAIYIEESYFRAALMREDIARLERLAQIMAASESLAAFQRDGLMIGWTPGDQRTFELKPALNDLMSALWETRSPADAAAAEASVAAAWAAFDRLRIDRLVGCLARVPMPD